MAIPKSALLAVLGLAAASAAFAGGSVDPNNPTGSHGLIVIDKIGRHVRFREADVLTWIAQRPD